MSINERFGKWGTAAAKATPNGWLGEHKVHIAAVYDYLATQGMAGSLDEFKDALIRANRERTLTLSRHDLAYAYGDQELIERSETISLNSTFHLIRVD